jgi:hypothetical protein
MNKLKISYINQIMAIVIMAGILAVGKLNAQDFGIHFLGNEPADIVTNAAGVVPITDWNNITNSTYTPGSETTIIGSDGSTTATLILSGAQVNNNWSSGVTGDGANQSLLDGYIDSGTGANPPIVTVSNLPSAYYNVYIYTFPDQSRPSNSGDWLPNYSVNGITYYYPILGYSGATTYTTNGVSVGGVGYSGLVQGTYVTANNNSTAPPGFFGNYVVVSNVQANAGVVTVEAEANNTTWKSPLNGIELVPTTPPAAPNPITLIESPSGASAGVGAGTIVTLSGFALGAQPITYQWQTDGGSGNSPTNIPGATATNLVVNTAGWLPGTNIYDYVVANADGTNTSSAISISVISTSSTAAIGVQFEGDYVSQALDPSQVAGIIPHDFWNVDDETSGNVTTNVLVDSSGIPTAATVTVTYGSGQYYSGGTGTTADDTLMSGGFWSGDGFTVNVTGVPYSTYNIYVYMLNDNNPGRRYGLTLGNQTYWGAVFNGNTYNAPPFTLDTQTTELPMGSQMQADVVEFAQVTNGSFNISGVTPDGTVAMMGIEIVNPEAGPAIAQPISINPGGTTIYGGDPVQLSEFPYGAPPVSYQWLTDGGSGGSLTNIPGATGGTLSLNTSGFSGNYNYEVVVSNDLASSTSAVTTVTIANSAPVLETDIFPTPNSAAFVGQTVTFSPVFGGTLPITYQWTVDTGTGPTNIPGATSSMLVLNSVQISNSGTYSLTAVNALGGPLSTSSSMLTVLPVPPPPAPNTYGATVLSAGPVAYWRFNEDADPSTGVLPTYDATGNGFDGVYGQYSQNGFDGINGPQPPSFPSFETNNYALSTENDLTNSWVTIPTLNLNTNTVTVTMWIYPTANEQEYAGLLVNRPYGAGFGFGGTLNASGMPALGYEWNNNAESTWNFNTGLYPLPNQWSFVALVIQPTNTTIYLEYVDPNTGALDVYSTNNPGTNVAASFNTQSTIGTDLEFANARAFTGSIDEVAVYNRVLTGNQLLSQFVEAAGYGISIAKGTGSNLTVTWSQSNATLLVATNLAGPWVANPSATSPYSVMPTNAQQFFRILINP